MRKRPQQKPQTEKETGIEVEGTVVENLPNARFREVEIAQRQVATAVDGLQKDMIRIRGGQGLPIEVFNSANDTTFGMYVNDTYKPLPNLTLTLGVRFDRETTDSFGYTHFDPRAQRATRRIQYSIYRAVRGTSTT